MCMTDIHGGQARGSDLLELMVVSHGAVAGD